LFVLCLTCLPTHSTDATIGGSGNKVLKKGSQNTGDSFEMGLVFNDGYTWTDYTLEWDMKVGSTGKLKLIPAHTECNTPTASSPSFTVCPSFLPLGTQPTVADLYPGFSTRVADAAWGSTSAWWLETYTGHASPTGYTLRPTVGNNDFRLGWLLLLLACRAFHAPCAVPCFLSSVGHTQELSQRPPLWTNGGTTFSL
jgi:hypothetical protein